MSWFSKAIKSAGKGISSGFKGVASGAHFVARQAGRVPVVGGGLKGVFDITLSAPLQLSSDIVKGERVDRGAMRFLKTNVQGAQAVGPYVQMVVSSVPGLGTLPSAAIAGALALSHGRPITDALIEGVKGAVPGGPLAQGAFSITADAVRGRPLDQAGLNALPLTSAQKKAISTTIAATRDLASGKNVSTTLLNAGSKQLPPEVQKAVNLAIAVGHGANLQKAASKAIAPAFLKRMRLEGAMGLKHDHVMQVGARLVSNNRAAYETATGLMRHRLNPLQLSATRRFFKGADRKAFDLAVSAHVGATARKAKRAKKRSRQKPLSKGRRQHRHVRRHHKPSKKVLAAAAKQFGKDAALGMQGQPLMNKESMLRAVISDPNVAAGVKAAVKERSSIWQRLLRSLSAISDQLFSSGADR